VTTGRGGSFTRHNLNTNTSYGYKDVVQYQTFTRVNENPINIDVNPYESGAGEGLHVQLGALPSPVATNSTSGIEIADGEIKENSKVDATWGIHDVDPEAGLRHTWRKMPWGGHNGPWIESAAVETNPTARVLVATKDNYQWNLDIVNPITTYCHGGQNPTGGEGEASPQFKTTITLPDFATAGSFWIINLKANTYVDIDNDNSLGSKGLITLSGRGLTKTLSFAVTRSRDVQSLKIDSLEPGTYTLELQAPDMKTSCYGPPGFVHKATYTTNLSVDILANNATPVKPTPYTLYYWAGSILLFLIVLLVVIKKSRLNRRG
jgi:hypothetical protein